MTARLLAAFAALSIASLPAAAIDLPEIEAAMGSFRKSCIEIGGTEFKTSTGFIVTADFNGDGRKDYLLDTANAECVGLASAYCGTGGCGVMIFVSDKGRYITAFDDMMRDYKIRKIGKKQVLDVDFHGSVCDKAGAEECPKRLVWDGKTMAIRDRK
jgi:hypothetical protein